jgi:hypothetical protein
VVTSALPELRLISHAADAGKQVTLRIFADYLWAPWKCNWAHIAPASILLSIPGKTCVNAQHPTAIDVFYQHFFLRFFDFFIESKLLLNDSFCCLIN